MEKIIFFGSSPFSCVVLEKIAPYCTAIITKEDKPVGRHLKLTPNPVKILAQKLNIPVFTKASEVEITDQVGLVAAYGKILKPDILAKFAGKIYNIHPSLLPKYRGPSPLQQQILDEVVNTGVTIIQMDEQMDHGLIVAIAHDTILPEDTSVSLGHRLFALGTDIFLAGAHAPIPQDHTQATYTKLLTRQDGFVEYSELSNKAKINKLFRAFYPWPGVWSIDPTGKRIILKQPLA